MYFILVSSLCLMDLHVMSTQVLILIVSGGGGQSDPATQNLEEKKCPCMHNNNTAVIKQISLFDTALAMTEA